MNLFKLGFRGFVELNRVLLSRQYSTLSFETAPHSLANAGINLVAKSNESLSFDSIQMMVSCHRLWNVRISDCDRITQNLKPIEGTLEVLVIAFTCKLKPNIEKYLSEALSTIALKEAIILSPPILLSPDWYADSLSILSAFTEPLQLNNTTHTSSLTGNKDDMTMMIGDYGAVHRDFVISSKVDSKFLHNRIFSANRREANGDIAFLSGKFYATVDPATKRWDAIFSTDISQIHNQAEDVAEREEITKAFLRQSRSNRYFIEIEAYLDAKCIESVCDPHMKGETGPPIIAVRDTIESALIIRESSVIAYPLKKRSHSLCLRMCDRVSLFDSKYRKLSESYPFQL